MLHNYKEVNNQESILHLLIPKSGIKNEKCLMFHPKIELPNSMPLTREQNHWFKKTIKATCQMTSDNGKMELTPSQPESSTPIYLSIIGPIPSFKNRKRICRNRLITDPKVKERMKEIEDSMVSQLISLSRIGEGKTWTDAQRRFWIASCVPEDDAWSFIPRQSQTGEIGNGYAALITIESL